MRIFLLLFLLPLVAYSCKGTAKGSHNNDKSSARKVIAGMKNTLSKSKNLLHTLEHSLREFIIDLETQIEVDSQELGNALHILDGQHCSEVSPDTPNTRDPRALAIEDDTFPTDRMLQNVTYYDIFPYYPYCIEQDCNRTDGVKKDEIGRSVPTSEMEIMRKICPNGIQHLRHLGFTGSDKQQGALNLNGEGRSLGWVSVKEGACGATRAIYKYNYNGSYDVESTWYGHRVYHNSTWPIQDEGRAQFYTWHFWTPWAKPSTGQFSPITTTTTIVPTTTTEKKHKCNIPCSKCLTDHEQFNKTWLSEGEVSYSKDGDYFYLTCPLLFIGSYNPAHSTAFTFGATYRCNEINSRWEFTTDDPYFKNFEGHSAPDFITCGSPRVTGSCHIIYYDSDGTPADISIYSGQEQFCPQGQVVQFNDGTEIKSISCTGTTHDGTLSIVTVDDKTNDLDRPALKCVDKSG